MSSVPEELDSVFGIRCGCGGELVVSSVQESFALICDRGHQLKVEDLVGTQSSEFGAALDSLLRSWEAKLESLKNLSVSARTNGFEAMSVVFNRNIQKLEARVELLRGAAKPPSTRILPPEK